MIKNELHPDDLKSLQDAINESENDNVLIMTFDELNQAMISREWPDDSVRNI
jgi:hypothetical protein